MRGLMEELSPFVTQCGADGEQDTWPRPVWHRTHCGYCAQPVTFEDGVSLFSESPERIHYPDERVSPVRAVLEHKDCGPDVGYFIPFKRLLKDGLRPHPGWVSHLASKTWYSPVIDAELTAAYSLAKLLGPKPEPEPETAPLPTKPYLVTRRPSRVSDNPRSISKRTRTRIMERDGFKCRRCGAGPSDARLVVDHIIPVAKGGTAHETNLQTLCQPCNAGKSDREPHPHDLGAK